jgi:hypothetical protein
VSDLTRYPELLWLERFWQVQIQRRLSGVTEKAEFFTVPAASGLRAK